MAMQVLVLFGPTLGLARDPSMAEVREVLQETAAKADATVEFVASNHEGVLLDALERHTYEAVLVFPGPAAPSLHVLALGLSLCGKPCAEVLFDRLTAPSALSPVCQVRHIGRRVAREAFEELLAGPAVMVRFPKHEPATDPFVPITLTPQRLEKSLGRAPLDPLPRPLKTLGPRIATETPANAPGPTRAMVRGKLAERLSDLLSAEGLTVWARGQWQAMQMGAVVEEAHRTVIDEVLMLLAASTTHDDGALVAFMAKLDT